MANILCPKCGCQIAVDFDRIEVVDRCQQGPGQCTKARADLDDFFAR